jgi:hypothetical protein
LAALLFENNRSEVAKRYGVPESTLRTWEAQARKMQDGEKQNVWDAARADAIRQVTVQAAQGAQLAEELLHRKLARGLAVHDRREALENELDALGPPMDGEDIGTSMQRERLLYRHGLATPMSETAAANILRTLTSVSAAGAAERMTREGAAGTVLEIAVVGAGDDAEEYAK